MTDTKLKRFDFLCLLYVVLLLIFGFRDDVPPKAEDPPKPKAISVQDPSAKPPARKHGNQGIEPASFTSVPVTTEKGSAGTLPQ